MHNCCFTFEISNMHNAQKSLPQGSTCPRGGGGGVVALVQYICTFCPVSLLMTGQAGNINALSTNCRQDTHIEDIIDECERVERVRNIFAFLHSKFATAFIILLQLFCWYSTGHSHQKSPKLAILDDKIMNWNTQCLEPPSILTSTHSIQEP